jgi:hypothetical protein
MITLNPAALSAAQAAGEATYMAATDDREALPQAIEAAIGAYLEGLWRPIEEAPSVEEFLAPDRHGNLLVVQKYAGFVDGRRWVVNAQGRMWSPTFWLPPFPLPPKDTP